MKIPTIDQEAKSIWRTINQEIEELSNSQLILDSIFHLSMEQIQQYRSKGFSDKQREEIILKFAVRLNDIEELMSICGRTKIIDLRIGDLAFFCLAKTEQFPFALATGRQNCTVSSISSEISIPTNFIYYTSFEREKLTYHIMKYLHSEERHNYRKKKGI